MNVTPISLQEYSDALSGVKLESVFQLPQYHHLQGFIHPEEYRFAPFKIEGNGKTFLIPLIIRERTKGFPEYIVPFNSIYTNQQEIKADDYALIFEVMRQRSPFRIKISASLKNPHPFSSVPAASQMKIAEADTYFLSLPSCFEEWFASISSNTRNQIRKAEKLGLKIYQRGADGLENFIALFYRRFFDNVAMLKTWPACFFYKLFEVMPRDSVVIYEAWFEDKIVASTLIILRDGECFYHSAAYDESYKQVYSNHLIQSHIIARLIGGGYKGYNMGGTAGSESLVTFKEKFGAQRITYHVAKWRNRFLSFRNSFRLPTLRKVKVEKLLLLKKDLKNDKTLLASIPPVVEWFATNKREDLEQLISEGYDLRGKDERGKLFMSEEIAKTRLAQKQTVFLAFWRKILVHSMCGVGQDSLRHTKIIPPIHLSRDEFFLDNGNTPVFFRQLGYHKLFVNIARHLLKEQGFGTVYGAVSEANVASLKAVTKAGFRSVGSFYLLQWRKRYLCVGTRRLIRSMKKNAALSVLQN